MKITKRTRQKWTKAYLIDRKGLNRLSYLFSICAVILALLAKHEYYIRDYEWNEITGRVDILLLSFGLIFTLVNIYIKSAVLFFQMYLGIGNYKWTLCMMLIPLITNLYSLITIPSLYVVPVIMMILVHFYTKYRSNIHSKKTFSGSI